MRPKVIGWALKAKYPNDYELKEAMINQFTMELPPPGSSTVSISPFFLFQFVLRPDRLRALTTSLLLQIPGWEENSWRGAIEVAIQSYPPLYDYGTIFSQVNLNSETSPTFVNRVIMRFIGHYSFYYRLVVWSSCYNRSGPGPFNITWRVLAETWQVVSHEE